MSEQHRLRDFLAASDAFCAAPCDRDALAALAVARLRLLEGAEMPSAPWTGMLRVMVALATAAQEAAGREDRRAAIGEALHAALCAW
ncbi:MAG: hypothetical protein NW203_06420, partial [Hyphomonadaceae bacterium]|nr:hypothetical protein [Hyphomonadaceae bacterium]